ncbi:hypothetical protein KC717_03415 [Candidatus Dojkabacteria bacterium]|uniref:Uncharacterized protein n=1 Tax=Candidatus Dojkabacteria bacterium TaxID=2099670 RepID=A0A955L8K0_9BACT|nr:hypothetical protein [Candidatus Dojkabacteria bacterium]
MLKKLHGYKDHLIILIGSNLVAALNFVLSIVILKIADEQSFNIYSAYASFYLILTTPSKLGKSLATVYGFSIIAWAEKIFSKFKLGITLSSVIISLLTIVGVYLYGGDSLISASVLVLATLSQILLLVLIGALQHNKQFVSTSSFLFSQNSIRLIAGIGLFLIFQNLGIWLATLGGSLLLFFVVRRFVKQNNDNYSKISIDLSDILLNLFVLLSVELLFNIDSILVLNSFPTDDAYIYNSLVLVKKIMFFATYGFATILLSDSRREGVNQRQSLIKNIGITALVGGVLTLFLYELRGIILPFLGLGMEQSSLYLLFTIGTLLFTMLMLSTLSFTSTKSMSQRILAVGGIGVFISFYVFQTNSIESLLNTFVFGTIGLLIYQGTIRILFRQPKTN